MDKKTESYGKMKIKEDMIKVIEFNIAFEIGAVDKIFGSAHNTDFDEGKIGAFNEIKMILKLIIERPMCPAPMLVLPEMDMALVLIDNDSGFDKFIHNKIDVIKFTTYTNNAGLTAGLIGAQEGKSDAYYHGFIFGTTIAFGAWTAIVQDRFYKMLVEKDKKLAEIFKKRVEELKIKIEVEKAKKQEEEQRELIEMKKEYDKLSWREISVLQEIKDSNGTVRKADKETIQKLLDKEYIGIEKRLLHTRYFLKSKGAMVINYIKYKDKK